MEDKVEKKSHIEQEKENRLRKKKQVVRELQDNMKHNDICIIEIPGEEEEQGIKNMFEKLMMENYPNVMREKSPKSRRHRESQSRGTQRGPPQHTS